MDILTVTHKEKEAVAMSKKKKKNKVIHLTEEEYGKYLMSLKEERPTKVVVPEEEK